MKFGAVPPREAEGAVAVHSIRKDGMVLKKGTLVGKAEIAALEAAKVSEIVVARLEPGDVSEDVAAAEIAAAVAGEGVHVDRAFTGRANLFAEACRRARGRQGRRRCAQRRRSGDHVCDAQRLCAGRRRQDDRDGEDHSVCGRGRGARPGGRGRARRAADRARRAVPAAQDRHHLDRAAGPRRQGDREDLAGDAGAARARERRRSSPSGACRTRPRRSPRRSTRC